MKRHCTATLFLATLAILLGIQACQERESYELSLHPQSVNVDLNENDPVDIRYLYVSCLAGEYLVAIFDEYVEDLYGLILDEIPEEVVSSDYLRYKTIIAL